MLYLLVATLLTVTLAISTEAHADSILQFNSSNELELVQKTINPPTKSRRPPKINRDSPRSKPPIDREETIPARNLRGRAIVRWKEHRMPDSVAEKLMEIERKFGPIQIISSCRPGATVKNTNTPSMHRYCRAVDFYPPKNKYSEVSTFLKRTWSGGIGTYSGKLNHIHIDDNRGRWHN
jgi:hypothetical protein